LRVAFAASKEQDYSRSYTGGKHPPLAGVLLNAFFENLGNFSKDPGFLTLMDP
jgi:hypothetical protein